MGWIKNLLCVLLVLFSWQVGASQIVVLGLFKDKVVLKKDSQRLVLKTGDSTPDGLKVISVNHKQAVIEIQGKQEVFELGTQIHTAYTPPNRTVLRIPKDKLGMYRTSGTINQQPIQFMVDTGATLVAININHAKALNIAYEDAPTVLVETASGKATAYKVVLDHVSVGPIKLTDVPAVVVNSTSPKDALLGMSFLKHLKMHNADNLMILERKY